MPPAKAKSAPGLDITFAPGTPSVLYPGQTLSGTVTLSTTEESVSIGSITVTFYGRAKAKVFQSYGQSSAVYRSRAHFFNIEQELFKSDYTYGPSEHSWPFSIELPFVADESCLKGKKKDRFKPHNNYYSTDTIDVVEQEMPPPMYHYHGMWGRACWGFVEYVLEATITEAEGTHTIRSPQSRSTIRPLNFQPGRREQVLTDYAMRSTTRSIVLKSSRLSDGSTSPNTLTPSTSKGDQNGHLSPQISNDPVIRSDPRAASPLRGLFSRVSLSSSTPRLTLTCTVAHPTVLQVYHPDPIPLLLTITPDFSNQSTTIDPANLPTIRITSFSFHVMCTTRLRALTGLWQEHDSKTVALKLAKDVPVNHTMQLVPASTSTSSTHPSHATPAPSTDKKSPLSSLAETGFENAIPSSSSSSNTINLSTLFPLHLRAAKLGRIHEPILNPSFKSYNVSRTFGLRWAVEFEVLPAAGQQGKVFVEKLKGEVPRGEVLVRGPPDGVREGWVGEGVGDGLVDYEDLVGRDDDDEDDEEGEGGDGAEKGGLLGVDAEGKKGGKARKGLWGRRSHDGGSGRGEKGSGKSKEKEEYAAEDRAAARLQESGDHGEQLPKYEA